jgi:hypothetical protein
LAEEDANFKKISKAGPAVTSWSHREQGDRLLFVKKIAQNEVQTKFCQTSIT